MVTSERQLGEARRDDAWGFSWKCGRLSTMNEQTAEIILDCLQFFELSDDEAIDADAAIQMLENVAASLQRLEKADQQVLLEVAARRSAGASDPEIRRFYEMLPEALGLRS